MSGIYKMCVCVLGGGGGGVKTRNKPNLVNHSKT